MNTRSPRTFRFTIVTAVAVAAGALSFGSVASAATNDVVGLAAGDNHTCAVTSSGAVGCWGDNAFGQLGNPDVETSHRPVNVALPADAHIVDIAAGAFHTCALAQDARVFCWGDNSWGSVGSGNFANQLTPQLVTLAPSVAKPVSITAGGFTSCVAMSNGTAQCWGRNQYGEVGDGTRVMRNTPVAVNGVIDAVGIDAGANHTCIVRAIGRMQCWGRAADDRTGDMTYPNVALLSAGGSHTCVRTTTGGLHCWGLNTHGQLTLNDIDSGIARITTGANHTCATTEAGTVVCWGASAAGQLGDSVEPVPGSSVVDVVAGANHTCALTDRAAVVCWGDSTFGQAGDHTLTTASAAVELIAATRTPAATTPPVPADSQPVDPQPITPQPTETAPPATPVADAPAATSPVAEPVAEPAPAVNETPAVEKQATNPAVASVEAPATTPAPVSVQKPASLPRLRTISTRRGSMLPVTRVARAAGVRVPSALIVSSLNATRSVSNHAWSAVRVEMSVPNTAVCRNVLTPSLTAALRVMKAGTCYVTVRVAREAKPVIVRTVLVRSVVPVNTARPNRNDARHPL